MDEGAMKTLVAAHKIYAQLLISLYLLFFPFLSASARDITFNDVLITNNAGQILVYARATNCFSKNVEAAILAGVPTTFTFFFDLYRERPLWWDKKIIRRIIKHTIKYDNVVKNFHISSTNSQDSVTFQALEAAKRAVADLNGVVIYPVGSLAKDKSYYLKMKAKKKDQLYLPLRMEYLSFFTSLWDFGTGWQEQKISYRNLTAP